MTNEDWNLITDTIEAQKCVLLLGPEILVSEQIDYHANLLELLKKELGNDFSYHEQDGFFMLNNVQARTRISYKYNNFYKTTDVPEIYNKIAQIPFNLIVSINPDFFIRDAFKNQGFKNQFNFFNKKRNMGEVEAPTVENPLIYNLFGSIDEHDSLVLTHDDMFVFLQSILGAYDLPIELQTALEKADYFIFLGFKFEKWYVQLIIRLLNLHIKKGGMQYAFNKNISQNIKSFYYDEFKIDFIDHDVSEFINQLYKRCKEYEILKIPVINNSQNKEFENLSVSKKVEFWLEKGNFDNVVEILKKFFEEHDPEIAEEIVIITNKINRIQRKITKGMIDNKESEIEFANITNNLLQLNKEVKTIENK